ncbi:MAG: TetR/AcrR family transcriptional regulator [Thermoguttaceae bacterium]|nr:TetR/AcrR family transcriptional regulator [Thermoguttaceae bacterium]
MTAKKREQDASSTSSLTSQARRARRGARANSRIPDDNALKARRIMSASRDSINRSVVTPQEARLPKEEFEKLPLRARLVLAAIDEIENVGFERFSMRRVAAACGASCAAPYKHFKNRHEIVVAILEYISDVWLERQKKTLKRFENETLRVQLVELALEYIRFMVENPRFRSILMIKDETFDESYLHVKARISDLSKELILRFCQEQGIDPRVARVKMYVVRSLIYGFSLMFGNNELPYNDNMTRFIRALIQREIELPWTAGFSEEDVSRGAKLIEYLACLGPDVEELGTEITPEPRNFPLFKRKE